ncbi:MAG TPA: hypothetical protein VMF29_00310, partial [Candidatus Edwardsbacteria bacterium]|nr:hypothetical protein [Candidatus Edwardsbacteria bacterium]
MRWNPVPADIKRAFYLGLGLLVAAASGWATSPYKQRVDRLLKWNQPASALRLCDSLLATNQGDIDAYLEQGRILLWMDSIAQARRPIEQARQREPRGGRGMAGLSAWQMRYAAASHRRAAMDTAGALID